jgi:hypothetical protein
MEVIETSGPKESTLVRRTGSVASGMTAWYEPVLKNGRLPPPVSGGDAGPVPAAGEESGPGTLAAEGGAGATGTDGSRIGAAAETGAAGGAEAAAADVPEEGGAILRSLAIPGAVVPPPVAKNEAGGKKRKSDGPASPGEAVPPAGRGFDKRAKEFSVAKALSKGLARLFASLAAGAGGWALAWARKVSEEKSSGSVRKEDERSRVPLRIQGGGLPSDNQATGGRG